MSNVIGTLGLALSLASLAPAATAQYPYNRWITSVGVRPDPGQTQHLYEVRVGLEINVDESAPLQGSSIDLSAEVRVFVDGNLRSSTPWDAELTMIDGELCNPCSGPCGFNEDAGFTMFCTTPPESTDCLCTSDVFLDADPVEILPGSNVTVTIVAHNWQLPEIYVPDDTVTFPFIGANYCLANPNSTGEPAVVEAFGSASLSANDLRLVASPLPANQFGIFYYGASMTELPFGEGYRCVGGQVFRLGVSNSGTEGVLSTTLDLANPPEPAGLITAGSTQYFQAWYRDPSGGPIGFNLSDGYMIAFIP